MSEQIGWSNESKLLKYILKQLQRLTGLIANVGATVVETDPVFTAWDKSTGISITESQISDLKTYLTDVAGDTTPQLGGDLDVNGKSVDWGAVISTNTTYKGETLSVTVDTNSIGFGALLAQASDFHFDEADALAMATCNMLVLALEAGTGTKKVLLKGQICNTSWNWVSGAIYASETSGQLTQTLPTAEDAVIAVVGWALSGDTIYFNPYNAWATIYAETTTTTTTTVPTTTTTTTV